jgi:hypothetical protein
VLHRHQFAPLVDAQPVRCAGIFEIGRDAAVDRDPDDPTGLRLGKQQAAVGQAERPLGPLETFADQFDPGAGIDDAREWVPGRLLGRGRTASSRAAASPATR